MISNQSNVSVFLKGVNGVVGLKEAAKKRLAMKMKGIKNVQGKSSKIAKEVCVPRRLPTPMQIVQNAKSMKKSVFITQLV